MPPRKNATTGQVVKSKSAKQIDDLIGSSEVPEGELNSELSQKMTEDKLRAMRNDYINFNNTIPMKRNAQNLVNMRCIVAIMIGVTAGILGFDGPAGIVYFFAINAIVSFMLALRFGFNAKPYFKSV